MITFFIIIIFLLFVCEGFLDNDSGKLEVSKFEYVE